MHPGGEGEHPPRGNGDGWIHGLLTGAERFLNTVLGSDTPSSASSSTSDSLSSEENGNVSIPFSVTVGASLLAFLQHFDFESERVNTLVSIMKIFD